MHKYLEIIHGTIAIDIGYDQPISVQWCQESRRACLVKVGNL